MPNTDVVPKIRIAGEICRFGGPISYSRLTTPSIDDKNSEMSLLKYNHEIDTPHTIPAGEWQTLLKMPAQLLITGYAEKRPFMLAITGFPESSLEHRFDLNFFGPMIKRILEKVHHMVLKLPEQRDSTHIMHQLSRKLIQQNSIDYPGAPYHVSFAIMYNKDKQNYCSGFAFQETVFEILTADKSMSSRVIPEGERGAPCFFHREVASTDKLHGRTDGIAGTISNPPAWLLRALDKSREDNERIVTERQLNKKHYSPGGLFNTGKELEVEPAPSCVLL